MGFAVHPGLCCEGAPPTAPGAVNLSFCLPADCRPSPGGGRQWGASAPWASLSLGLTRSSQEQTATSRSGGHVEHSPVGLFALAEAAPASKSLRLKRTVIKGDGRCLFRAMAQGLARNKGSVLLAKTEEIEADQLRLAVAEALCRSEKRRSEFKDAVKAVELEDELPRYCQRIVKPTFWGGEPEMLVLSKMLQVPLIVYLPEEELGVGDGYRPIQKYGEEYAKQGRNGRKARKPVRLLFCGGNHFDLLTRV